MRRRGWVETISLAVLLLGSGVVPGAATSPSDFDQANRLYEQGKYSEAIARYETLLSSGRVSPALFYNLGNACFKNGQLGHAIYNYRRAAELAPRDPDIQANLRFARDRVNGTASVQPAAWHRLATYFRVNELSIAAALLLWVVLLLCTVVRVKPALRTPLRIYITASSALLAVNLLWLVAAVLAKNASSAIVPVHQLTVHLGPLRESQAAFSVSDGTELRVENRREGWLQVSDRAGRTGWVEQKQVLVL